MALLVCVDDIVLASSDNRACNKFKAYLNACFSIKYVGPFKYFLEIEVARGPNGLFLAHENTHLR